MNDLIEALRTFDPGAVSAMSDEDLGDLRRALDLACVVTDGEHRHRLMVNRIRRAASQSTQEHAA